MAAKKKKKNAAPAVAGSIPATVNIESHLVENRIFPPAKGFAKKARISSMDEYRSLWKKSIKQPEKFWGNLAKDLDWRKKSKKTLEWKAPFAKWFVGGKLNVAENCLDRHLRGPRKNKAAIIWEGEPGEKRTLTYHAAPPRGLPLRQRAQAQSASKKGDRVLDLHADDSRGGRRHAGLRAHRRGALGRLRRLQRREHQGPRRRLRRHRHRHRRRRLPARRRSCRSSRTWTTR